MVEKDIILSKWLQGEISDDEVKALLDVDLDYLKSVLANQEKMKIPASDTSQQWNVLESKMLPKAEEPQIRNNLKWILLGGLILLGIAAFILRPTDHKTIVKPSSNEFLMYALQDGSEVRLWPESTLKIDELNYLNNRFIELEGQAFFDVQKGDSFTVKTNSAEVQVLGTSFDVWSPDERSTIVKCHTGRVRVSDNNQGEVILMAGEKVVIEDHEIGALSKFDPNVQKVGSGKKYYDNARVTWVIDDLKNLYNVPIKLNETIKAQRFTGLISTSDIDRALSYLCETMNWSYAREGKVVNIRSKG